MEPIDPAAPAEERAAAAREVRARLVARYDPGPWTPRREPLHELVSTMLSHRTTMADEDAAFEAMWARYGSWAAIQEADTDELARTLERATFPEPKAVRIQEALRRIHAARGEYAIDFLVELPPEEALAWLTELPGVGVKTASLVLLFCFAVPLLPVDTHVHRVSGRLGLIGPKVSAERAHRELLELFPRDAQALWEVHVSMLRHGQQLCRYSAPRCGRCPLRELCRWYAGNRAG